MTAPMAEANSNSGMLNGSDRTFRTVLPLIPQRDRALMKRLTIVIVFVLLATAAISHLHRMYAGKFLGDTGTASWIWGPNRISANEPAAFFATRDFDLPEGRHYAHLKILGDPEYTVWLNGTEVGGRVVGEQRELDFYDVTRLAKNGRNRLVVAVRAQQGVGGLIASIDLAPEQANVVVTDEQWRIYRRWDLALLDEDPPELQADAPAILGAPPYGRWNYLTRVAAPLSAPVGSVSAPVTVTPMRAMLPSIRTVSGIAVQVADPVRATAYDFGRPTRGRIRVTLDRPNLFPTIVQARFANNRDELGIIEWNVRTYVLAAGEQLVVDPVVRDFRYVLVYSRRARVEVLQ